MTLPLPRALARSPAFFLAPLLLAPLALAQQPGAASLPAPAQAAARQLPVFEIPQSGVEFQTGDTWKQNGQTFRLYGVQSCIRGTTFTNPAGAKLDCGEASIAYLAALIRDTKPRCTAVAQTASPPLIYTVCAAHVGANTLDLGTVMVTQGFAFAATDANGKPVNLQYAVAEGEAQKAKRGLWIARDLPHPTAILNKALRDAKRAQ
jgi:endonuclease YncB( thermonuclease family)